MVKNDEPKMDSYEQYLYFNKSSAKAQISDNWKNIDRYRNFKFYYQFEKTPKNGEPPQNSSRE